MVVVDPTVGSTRKAIVARFEAGSILRSCLITAVITLVEQRDGIECCPRDHQPGLDDRSKLSSTFHGRDIFSPVGAHMARGDELDNVGPEMPVKDLVRLDLQIARVDDQGLSATR